MEASSFVMRPTNPCFSKRDAGIHTHYSHSKPRTNLMMGFSSSSSSSSSSSALVRKQLDFGFYDKGQLDYYNCNKIRSGCGKKEKKDKDEKKTMKKRLKLLKGLSTDLSMFSTMMNAGSLHGLADDDQQVNPDTMSEAAELLLGHLQKLRAEEKELKKKKKEEKKALLTAARLQNMKVECDKSSSSSSESSDSECEREVVSMSRLKSNSLPASSANQPVIENVTLQNDIPSTQSLESVVRGSSSTQEVNATTSIVNIDVRVPNSNSFVNQECCSETSKCCSNEEKRVVTGLSSAKIEVCMGGKCKKSGAVTLLEEFQRVVGADVAVSGCKCMGKCKDGPNVRVVNNDSMNVFATDVRTPSNPLCIGVGLDDVGLIMTNFFGDSHNEIALSAAAAPAS